MASRRQWVSAARPRTLPAAVAPVLVGTGAALGMNAVRPLRAVLALVVALALQVGVNYANDYSDGVRGTDDDRVGPFRLTGSGAARPAAVLRAAMICFGAAAVTGLALVALSGTWWLIGVGAASIVAAWYYTGGSRPYGYAGFGEVFVFVFFGLVAVLGTTYTQALRLDVAAAAGAVGIGSLACAILVANNLRDLESDALTGKHTLAVRLGERATRALYTLLVVVAFAMVPVAATVSAWALIALFAVVPAIAPVRRVRAGSAGRDLIAVLGATGRLELGYAVLLGLGLALGQA